MGSPFSSFALLPRSAQSQSRGPDHRSTLHSPHSKLCQSFFWNTVPQVRQVMLTLPFILGTRSTAPQLGQRK